MRTDIETRIALHWRDAGIAAVHAAPVYAGVLAVTKIAVFTMRIDDAFVFSLACRLVAECRRHGRYTAFTLSLNTLLYAVAIDAIITAARRTGVIDRAGVHIPTQQGADFVKDTRGLERAAGQDQRAQP